MTTPARTVIRAAGVVLTRGMGRDLEVAVIRRRRQRDWSLPKGKLDPGEHTIEAAVRECHEETGFRPVLDVPLPTQHYRVDGVPKTVEYWRSTVVEGHFTPNREVDILRWMVPQDAARRLTYPRDGQLVTLAARTPTTIPFVLMRHTSAETRADWQRRTGRDRDDPDRGLLERGEWEARRIIPLLRAYGVRHLHSSDSERCVASLRPYESAIGAGIRMEPTISEQAFAADPHATVQRTVELFNQPWAIVLCSHRPVIPSQLEAIRTAAGGPRLQHRLAPGDFVVYHRTWVNRPGDLTARVVAAEQQILPRAHE